MIFKYDASANAFHEQPNPNFHPPGMSVPEYQYWDLLHDYNLSMAALLKIPCDESCKNVFEHGKEYVPGTDFEIRLNSKNLHNAYPANSNQKELWQDVINCVFDMQTRVVTVPEMVEEIKRKFHVKRQTTLAHG